MRKDNFFLWKQNSDHAYKLRILIKNAAPKQERQMILDYKNLNDEIQRLNMIEKWF